MIIKNAKYKQTLDNFYQYLDEILRIYEDAVPVLQEEFTAIAENNIPLLNENLKVQQAMFLKTKQFDSKVHSFLTELNMPTTNLSAMIAELPPEEGASFQQILDRFNVAGKNVLFYRDKCKALLQQRLYRVDKVLEHYEQTNNLYDGHAGQVQAKSSGLLQTRA